MTDTISLADHKPVAWKYRWKIDGEYVGWRYSDASNAHPSLDGFEEVPLYDAPNDHRLAVALAYQRAARVAHESEDVYGSRDMHAMAKCARNIAAAILALADTDALAEVTRLRAQIEAADKLAEAVDRLRKLHEQSLRTADYHNVNCQCPRCIDDAIVAALSAYQATKGEEL